MKEKIKKYKKLIPTVGYWTLSKVFGVSIDKIFDILEYDNFDFITKTSYIISYEIRNLGRTEKYFENISGYWEKDVFINGNKIFHTNSKGKWVKYTYRDDKLFKKYFHDGHWVEYTYWENSNRKKSKINGEGIITKYPFEIDSYGIN